MPDTLFPQRDGRSTVTDEADLDCNLASVDVSCSAIRVQGLEHVCHNALRQISSKMKHFKSWYARALACARAFANNFYRDRLRFQIEGKANGAEEMERRLLALQTVPDEWRFGCMLRLIEESLLLIGLNQYFDYEKFVGKDAGTASGNDFVNLDKASGYIVVIEK